MPINIKQQYNSIIQEKEEFKKRLKKIEQKLLFLEKYLKHTEDIKAARKEKKLIPMEKVFRELGI